MGIFRILFTAAFLISLATVSVYRRKAQAGEQFDTTKEGVLYKLLRIFGLSVWLYLLAYMIYPPALNWSFLLVPDWLRWIGGLLALLVIPPLLIWAQRSLGSNVSTTIITRKEYQLVTEGPYKYIRHPLYMFGMLFFVSLGLTAASWFILVSTVIILAMLIVRIPMEEAQLEIRFGDAYVRYQKRTGRFFPKL